jgi:hypothetical protein
MTMFRITAFNDDDDEDNYNPNVIPAQAGIQWLCFIDEHSMKDLRHKAA